MTTPEAREASRQRGYRERRTIFPSECAQKMYPLDEYPCDSCAVDDEPPFLVDNGVEFGWEHHPSAKGGRAGCSRFGRSNFCGSEPRSGTATSLFWGKKRNWKPRTEEEYLKAEAVVEKGGDDRWLREEIQL